jgi:Fe-S cluster assembly protein SufD
MNVALSNNGIILHVGADVRLERPVHIACITDVRASHRLSTPRIVVVADQGASFDIVESHHTIGSLCALDVSVVEAFVAANAHIRYHKVIDDTDALRHIGSTSADVARDGSFTAHTVSLGAGFVRNDTAVRLVEPSSQAFLFGTSVLRGHEYADNHTVVDHAVPHCHSEELYKGIYDDSSVGVFNGKIYVRPQAQKTTAYQSSHAILLSERAQMNSKPQLEIWADDVKCSHGATTGQLDEDAVFYLQSRGIDAAKARALMTYAFVAEVIERIELPSLRQHLEERIADKLGAEPFAQ